MSDQPFSRRNRIPAATRDRLIEDDATPDVRFGVVAAANRTLAPSDIREIVCRRLIKEPDPGNWSDFPNVWGEVKDLIRNAPWYKVYDTAEDLYRAVARKRGPDAANEYQAEVNEALASEGIAWHMESGSIVRVGLETTRALVEGAEATLSSAGLTTAREAIEGALRDLSHRPNPDTPGAVHKAMAALESTMREWTGDAKSDLGELLKRHPGTFPPPMGSAIEKLWGFASDKGRHLKEGGAADFTEAELVVGVAASACSYLSRKKHAPSNLPM